MGGRAARVGALPLREGLELQVGPGLWRRDGAGVYNTHTHTQARTREYPPALIHREACTGGAHTPLATLHPSRRRTPAFRIPPLHSLRPQLLLGS